jgi:NNP family nitrate/nitrite transporter-like MFS transporter
LLVFWLFARQSPDSPLPKSFRNYLVLLKEPDAWWFNGSYMVIFGGFVGARELPADILSRIIARLNDE